VTRRRWRDWRFMAGAIASVAVLALTGCASGVGSAGATPTLRIDYPDFYLTPGPSMPTPMPIPDNAVPFYVATSALPTRLTQADVWTWPAGPSTSSDVRKLATALGLDGDPQRVADGWQLGTPDAMVRVYDDPGWPWSYTTSKTAAWWADMTCTRSGIFGPYFTCNNTPPTAPPSPTGSPSLEPTISAPDADQAPSIAQPLLTALGVTGPVSLSSIGSDGTTTVDVPPSLQGMPTKGFQTWIEVDLAGVVAAAGWLGTPKPGDAYPLISAAQAFDLSNGWTGGVCAAAAPMLASSAPPTSAFPMPSCQAPHPANVTGAVLGLDLEWQNEQPILVPAWFFTVEGTDGPVLGTVAIDRTYLAGPPSYSSPPTPTPSIPLSLVPSPSQSPSQSP
jgi:hypothetical protein